MVRGRAGRADYFHHVILHLRIDEYRIDRGAQCRQIFFRQRGLNADVCIEVDVANGNRHRQPRIASEELPLRHVQHVEAAGVGLDLGSGIDDHAAETDAAADVTRVEGRHGRHIDAGGRRDAGPERGGFELSGLVGDVSPNRMADQM